MKTFIVGLITFWLSSSVLLAQSTPPLYENRSLKKDVATIAVCNIVTLCDDPNDDPYHRCFKDYRSYARAYDTNGAGQQEFITGELFANNGHDANIVIKGIELDKPIWFTATNWNQVNLDYDVTKRRYIDAGAEGNEEESINFCRIRGGDYTDITQNVGDVDFRVNTDENGDGEIRLHPGFEVELGANFHAYISPKLYNLKRYEYDFRNQSNTFAKLQQYWNLSPDVISQFSSNVNITNDGIAFTPIITANRLTNYEITEKDPVHTSTEPFGRYESLVKMCTKFGTRVAPWFQQSSSDVYQIEYDVPEHNVYPPTKHCNGTTYTGYDSTPPIPWCKSCRNRPGMGALEWYGGSPKGPDFLGITPGNSGLVSIYDKRNCEDPLGQFFHLYSLEIDRDEVRFLIDDCVVARAPSFANRVSRTYDGPLTHTRGTLNWLLIGVVPLVSVDNHDLCSFSNDNAGNLTTVYRYVRVLDMIQW